MAIKTLGLAQKIRVGRESGNTTFILLGLTVCLYMNRINIYIMYDSGCHT